MSRKSTKKAASKKPVRMSASAARAAGAQRTRRALDAARGEALKAMAAADQENARKRDERGASPDALAASERAVAAGGKAAKARDAKPAKERKARRTSALDAAAMVLAEAKEPMRAKDLIERMAAKGLWTSPGGKTPEATLYAAMVREIKQKGAQARFRKAERGLFVAA
ncbi:MAG: winged helix-turn-helix domain-containing protein [Phycisphaerales bacterium]